MAHAQEVRDAFDRIAPTSADYDRNIASIRQRLLATRSLPLPQSDLDRIWREHEMRVGPSGTALAALSACP